MQTTLSLIRGFLGEIGGRLAPEALTEESIYRVPFASPRMASKKFFEIPTKPSSRMALRLFQTGRSRTFLVGEIISDNDARSVHYACVASGVLSRVEGELTPFTRPLTAHLILLDMNELDEDEVIERYREGIEIIDTIPDGHTYLDRRLAAIKQAERVQREMMEEGLLALNEGREPGVIIVVDGSLAEIEGAGSMSGIIGLVPATAGIIGDGNMVLDCPFGARTALDDVEHPPSFYMRLRDATGMNPDFGLVRVEFGLNAEGGAPDENYASDIANLLLAERFPVDLTDQAWDKTIFALHNAGKYIDTLIPTKDVVTTYFGRRTS